ncbi:MAG: prepilin-type N-terminal cleavage/methylation domain-containing protein [Phycisphaerae bacterium]|nr:prepilin-type N-terminal cleavage/methylation domain-containing protein [Phycisphaerae bacterium]
MSRRPGFTLIELLVVVAIIALLVSILLPALGHARAQGSAAKCKANLHHIGIGLVAYNTENNEFNVPSYNMPPAASGDNYSGGPGKPLDGWAAILDRDGVVPSRERHTNTIFYCSKTVDVEGMKDGQTGTDPQKPRGWVDWPLEMTEVGGDSAPKVAVAIPERGFNKIIRVSYWINAYNPIGNSRPSDIEGSDLYYTGSVGLGPDAYGRYIRLRQLHAKDPARLVVVSDGIYMGRQAVTRLGDKNSRVGYRHPGLNTLSGMANVAFADGHVQPILGDRFPQARHSSDTAEIFKQKKLENLSGPTVYEDPVAAFE